jgi:hypothetical protein
VEYEEKDECLSFHLGQSNFNLLCLETRKRRTPPTMNLFTWNDPKALAVFVTGSCMVEFLYALNLHKKKNTSTEGKQTISDGKSWKGSSNTHLRNFTFNIKDHEYFLAWSECLSRICLINSIRLLLSSKKNKKAIKRVGVASVDTHITL